MVPAWMPIYTTTTATTATTGVWYDWIGAQATSTAASIWYTWADDPTNWTYTDMRPGEIVRVSRPGVLTAHEPFPRPFPSRSDRLIAAAEEQYKVTQRNRDAALRRSRGLLLEHLNDVQRSDYKKNGWFLVDGPSGQRYRIRNGVAGNVDLLNPDGSVKWRLCAHASYDIPQGDQLLTQLLHLRHAEKDFLKIANRHAA